MLQSLAVCAHCGRRLRIQASKNYPTYYREDSHLRGYYDCPYSGQGIHAEKLDEQVAALAQSLKLPTNWVQAVREMLREQQGGPDPEVERKEIRSMLRPMRDNYEQGLYEGGEYQYWQKVSALKEKLRLLNRVPETAINKAAQTLLDLRKSWEGATREERKELVHLMIQEVGCDVESKCVTWVKVR